MTISKKSLQKQSWEDTRTNLAKQVNQLLFDKRMSVVDAAEQTGIPLHIMENISLGREFYHTGALRALANFLNKKIKIELVD